MKKQNTELSVAEEKRYSTLVKKIDNAYGAVAKHYINMCGDIAEIYEKRLYAADYANIYDLARERWSMSRGTVSNLLSIYKRFGDGNYHIDSEKLAGMNLTQALAVIKEEKQELKSAESSAESLEEDSEEVELSQSETDKKKNVVTVATMDCADKSLTKECINAYVKEFKEHILQYFGKNVEFKTEITIIVKEEE